MVTKRRLPVMAVGLALMALSGCVAAENKSAADFQCPTVWHDPLDRVIFRNGVYYINGDLPNATSSEGFGPDMAQNVAIQRENFWRGAILHGSNKQLDDAVAFGTSGAYGNVNSTWIRQAKTAQSLRHSSKCPDVPNFPYWNLL